jgi:hypothetical protein
MTHYSFHKATAQGAFYISPLLDDDGDKAQEVRNCSVTHYEFDPSAGTDGKLILRDFNRVYYS